MSKFEVIRDIVVILVTCKNEEDPLKNKYARVATTQNIDFSNTQGQITPQSEVGSGRNSNSSEILWMSLLFPKEDPNKNEVTRVATTLNIDFSHSQGQITLQSRVGSGWNSNSSEMLWLSLLLLSMKKIRSKLKALEWPQHKILIFQTLKGS